MTELALSPPHNLDAEMAVLGAALLADSTLEPMLVEVGLRAGHFYREQHAAVFGAMTSLHDQGRSIDWLTVADFMDKKGSLAAIGGKAMIDALAGCAPAAGNASQYARIVVDLATWRARQQAALGILAAVEYRDEAAFGTAEASIATADRPDETTSTAEQLADEVFAYLAGEVGGSFIELPFRELNRLLGGGLRPGDVTVVAGWTSMGKSCVISGFLEHAASQGAAVHLYTNEMSKLDTALRSVASLSRVPFRKLLGRNLADADQRQAMEGLQRFVSIGCGVTDCSGWSARDIARHVRRHRWDLAAIDLFNLIPHRGTEEADEISATINTAARQSGSHLLLACQLNQARNVGAQLPRPVRRDIRESGQIANDASNVVMVHRQQVELQLPGSGPTGAWEIQPEGSIYLEKARNGQLGGVAVRLDPARMRFVETPRDALERAA